jgi:hypothetical protein
MFTQHGDASQAQESLSADKVRSICEKKRIAGWLMSYAPERKLSGVLITEFPALFLRMFAAVCRALNRQLYPGIRMGLARLAREDSWSQPPRDTLRQMRVGAIHPL